MTSIKRNSRNTEKTEIKGPDSPFSMRLSSNTAALDKVTHASAPVHAELLNKAYNGFASYFIQKMVQTRQVVGSSNYGAFTQEH